MIFTGNELIKKRSFYGQSDNFVANFALSVDSPGARYEFGLSGFNVNSLVLESGQLKYGDLIISSYRPFSPYQIRMEFSRSGVNLLKNDSELAYGLTIPTGEYDYAFFKRSETGVNAEFDFYLSGNQFPSYQIDQIGYLLNSSQEVVTGRLYNNGNKSFRVFESIANGLQDLDYSAELGNVAALSNSKFRYSGSFADFNFTQPISTSFYTNFGDFQIDFKIIDIASLERAILLEEIDDYSFNDSNQINRTVNYQNYSGGLVTDAFNTVLDIKLVYVNGSGQFTVDDFAESASFTGIGVGEFSKSGLITGISRIVTGDSSVSGIYSVNFARFQWATGWASGLFSGNGIGIATGLNYTGSAVGSFTGIASGFIGEGSGTYSFLNTSLVGLPVGQSQSVNYTGYLNATGFIQISGLENGGSFFVGIDSAPIVNRVNFYNETGLAYYLNQNSAHKVSAFESGGSVYLQSRFSGEEGNGIFIRNNDCNQFGLTNYSRFLTGGINYGTTGSGLFSIGQPFTGILNLEITGSGFYQTRVSGNEPGEFTFQRTFTGAWSLLTGLSQDSLVQAPVISDTLISGQANLNPNSLIIFQVNHNDSPFNTDQVLFNISGQYVINPIQAIIEQ